MMKVISEVIIISFILIIGYILKRLKLTQNLNMGIRSSSYLISILLLITFNSEEKHLLDLLLVFKPIVYSSLLIKFMETIRPVDINLTRVLTKRELEVTEYISQGLTNKEIAEHLIISEMTVKKHVQNILRKTKCQNRMALIDLIKKKQ